VRSKERELSSIKSCKMLDNNHRIIGPSLTVPHGTSTNLLSAFISINLKARIANYYYFEKERIPNNKFVKAPKALVGVVSG